MDRDTHDRAGTLLERLRALAKGDTGDRPPLPGRAEGPVRAEAVAARPDPTAGLLERLRALEDAGARPGLPERAPSPGPPGAEFPHLRQPPDAPQAWAVNVPTGARPEPTGARPEPQPDQTGPSRPAGEFGTPRPGGDFPSLAMPRWDRTPLPGRAPAAEPRRELPPGGSAPPPAMQTFAAQASPQSGETTRTPEFPAPPPGVQWDRPPLPDHAPRTESPPPLPPGGRGPERPEVSAFGAERAAPGAGEWGDTPGLGRHAEAAQARLPEGGRGPLPGLGEWGGDRGGGLGEMLREGVELLRQLVQRSEGPAGAGGGGATAGPSVNSATPPGMRPWLAWSADDPNAAEHFPTASPSVNVSSIAGLRGAGGYGYGSLQPRSVQARRNEFLEPGRRKPL